MRHGIRFISLVIAVFGALLATTDAGAAEFRVFNATIFKDQPDLGGLPRLRLVYSTALWPNRIPGDTVPDISYIRKAMDGKSDPTGLLVIDIENWKLQGDPATVSGTVEKYLETLKRFRSVSPALKFGYYGVVPNRNYWDALAAPDSDRYRDWQKENNALMPIARSVDALFPSLYTFYGDQDGWKRYALANLAEARRMANGKPVYCFLWPQFHPSTSLKYQFLSGEYWTMELNTCRAHADGIVIWGGGTYLPDGKYRALTFDPSAPWWRATIKFLDQNHLGGR